jgi:hypothetical protein
MAPEIGAALIGVGGVGLSVIGVLVSVRLTRRGNQELEARRHRSEVVAAALADVFAAMAESSFGDQRQAMLLFAHAKARLVTYAPGEVVDAVLAFDRAGASGTNPAGQRAITALARHAREAAGVEEGIPDEDALELLFGSPSEEASAQAAQHTAAGGGA